MPEKMQPRSDNRNTTKEFFRAIIDIVIKVEDAERWRMGNENVRIIGDIWAHLQSSVFKLSKDLIDSIHEEGIVAYTS